MKCQVLFFALASGALFLSNSSAEEAAVIVTATRFPERAIDAPVGMTVIPAERIANSTAATLPGLLSQEAGIIARDNTGSPDWQIDMRGFGVTGDQNTLVLLNGQRLSEIELVSNRWSSIPLANIERIEIMRGSGAVLYGSGATGGTVNIITKSPSAGTGSATAGAAVGSYGTLEKHGSVSLAGDHVGFSLYANNYASDNYRMNNRIDQENLDGELRAFGPQGHLAFKFGLDFQDLRLPGARTAAQLLTDPRGASTPQDFATRDGSRASLGGRVDLGFGELAAELGYRSGKRTSLQKDYTGFGFPDIYLDTRTRVWSLTPRLKIPYEALGWRHDLVVGMDADSWDYDSRRGTSPQSLATPAAWVLATQQDQALYFQHHTALGDATKLTVGAREQRVRMAALDKMNPTAYASGGKTSSPRSWEIALRHDLTPSTAAYARLGQSFRIATVDEVYSQFGGPFFDAIVTLLEPQTSRDHEVGVEYRRSGRRLRASVFVNNLNNEIYFFAPTFSNINMPPTRRQGLEFEASMSVAKSLQLFGGLSFTQATFRDGVIGGVDVKGKTIPLVPRNAGQAGLSWQLAEASRLNALLRHVGGQRYDNDQTNSFPTQMPAYSVVDVKFVRAFGRVNFSAAVNNLTNKRYYSYAIRNGAGTSFNAYPHGERSLLMNLEYRF